VNATQVFAQMAVIAGALLEVGAGQNLVAAGRASGVDDRLWSTTADGGEVGARTGAAHGAGPVLFRRSALAAKPASYARMWVTA